jgi:hypothetical protein
MSSYLLLERLILVGFRKNYTIKFSPGVNLIYGDSDTGKSSILEFINYQLGSGHIELAEEILSSVRYAALETIINGDVYTIVRNIHENNAFIEVFQCYFSEKDQHYPKLYNPNFSVTGAPDGYYSDFLLESLNFPKIKTKDSPTKDGSAMRRLSFRRLFEYCYLNQDDVGSKGFLNYGNWSRNVGTKEVFKYMFNVLDSNISELELEISEKTSESKNVKQKYEAVTSFLRDTDYENLDKIEDEIDALDHDLEVLAGDLQQLNSKMVADSENYHQIKAALNQLSTLEKKTVVDLKSTESSIDNYSRLRNDYNNDIEKISALKVAKNRIGSKQDETNICPICDSEFTIIDDNNPFQIASSLSIEEEMKSLKKRKRNIQKLIDRHFNKHRNLNKNLQEYRKDLLKVREMLDTETQDLISPYLTQRDNVVKEIASKTQIRDNHLHNLKIRNKQNDISKKYTKLINDLDLLKSQLKELIENAPKLDQILLVLGQNLKGYLQAINIKNRHGIAINPKTFTPVIRGKDYHNITSGGLRTISSIGHLLGLLKYSITNDIYHPRLLMIDTVGKYLGKKTKEKYIEDTNLKDDVEEGLSDPEKYRNMYEAIIDLAQVAKEKERVCQMILVDNDVPDQFIERYRGFIVAHYSSTGADGLQKGLIDDI